MAKKKPVTKEPTVAELYAALPFSYRGEVRLRLREACMHLASCWDAMRAAERILSNADHDVEIETEDIIGPMSNVTKPEEAMDFTEVQILEILVNAQERRSR